MATVKKGTFTKPPQWWKHLKWWKKLVWNQEKQAVRKHIKKELE